MSSKKIKTFLKKLERLSADTPVKLAFIVALATFIIVNLFSWLYWYSDFDSFLEGILIEAYGMVFDLFVIGVFILWLNRLGERRREIKRYKEQIDDFRWWMSREASHRIAGNVRRLTKNGVSEINLNQVCLVNANLKDLNLVRSNFSQSDLSRAKFNRSNLSGAWLSSTKLERTVFNLANLQSANLRDSDLSYADLAGANLKNANLENTKLAGARLLDTNLEGANLKGISLGNQGVGIFKNVKTLYSAQFEEDLEKILKKNYPLLFQISK